MVSCVKYFAMDAIGVEDRSSSGRDVDDFTFVRVEGHLPILLPGLETIKVTLELV